MKLLIVDDNIKIRLLLRNICEHLFESIFECEDGDEAIRFCTIEKPEWVLMDIKMKRIDGLLATREIKRIVPATRIIIVSQFVDKIFMSEILDAGAVDFVKKEDLTKLESIFISNNYKSL
jgi:CheY-like chemotaxis protein